MSSSNPSPLAPQPSSPKPSRLGIFGGTFNPIHNGHIAIAGQTCEALGLDRILFIPTGDPPHKSPHQLVPGIHRYEMVRLAIGPDRRFSISDIELRRPGKSYTIDTIRLLQEEYGTDSALYFLIGLDAFLEFSTWREPKALLGLCSFVVISRPGLSFQSLAAVPLLPPLPLQPLADLDAGRRSTWDVAMGTRRLICLRLPPSEVSASDIRRRIGLKLPVANLLPPPVESYILQHHLYE